MSRFRSHRTPGQSMVIVALFAVLTFLMIGLAIDGGMIYAQRRMMQNIADTACLAAANKLALNKSDSTAQAAAIQVIGDSLGANMPGTLDYGGATSSLYTPATYDPAGTDPLNLVRGIVIDNADVRVALQSPAYTYFMRVIGIAQYTVAARAHCNSVAGGGAVPFAVARWRGFDTPLSTDVSHIEPGLTTDKTLPQFPSHSILPMTVRDILAQGGQSVILQWPDWGSSDYPGDSTASTGLYSNPTYVASESSPGFETVLAGQEANANVPSNTSFSGPIVLDFRQTTFPQPLYYNGLSPDTALNQYKDFATRYILGQYPGPSVTPGQQLAYYSGVSAGLIEKPFDLRYNVGDIVSTLIYNGTIYDSPSFSTTFPNASASSQGRAGDSYSGTCSIPGGSAFDGNNGAPSSQETRKPAANFKITLTPQNYTLFKLRAFFSTDPGGWGDMQGRWNSGSWSDLNINSSAPSVSVSPSGRTIDFDLKPSATTSCTISTSTLTTTIDLPLRNNGAQSIYLEAQDTNTSRRHGVYALLEQWSGSSHDANDFWAYFPGELAYDPLEPGQSASGIPFTIKTVGGTDLFVGSGGVSQSFDWFSTNLTPIAAPSDIAVSLSKSGGQNKFQVNVGSNAQTGREYYVRITIAKGSYTHYAWYYVQVRPPLNNSQSISQYVYALGYASFKITYIDSNTIKGRAVSGLQKPEDLKAGLVPRLVPWQ